jgi:hypothetical protein
LHEKNRSISESKEWGNGIAVSLAQKNQSFSMKDVNIARVILGKRHGAVSWLWVTLFCHFR